MKTITEFCDKHKACDDGRKWALENCKTMQEAWTTAKPQWVVWIATRPRVLTSSELRLFAAWSARQVQHLMKDPRSIAALDVAERHANGEATDEDLAAARSAAWDAEAAAGDAAWSAAEAAARDAARTAAWTAAWDAQSEWLRDNTKPDFN